MNFNEIKVWLKDIKDPEMGFSLVDLGLIYSAKVELPRAVVKMTLTSPGCPMAAEIRQNVYNRMMQIDGVKECLVELVFTPKWNPAEMASDEVKDKLGVW
jgi:metal-sulfur cluster biosynthetic enzyme